MHPKIKHAQLLLAAAAGVSEEAIAASVVVSLATVYRTKRRFVEGNLDAALAAPSRGGAQAVRQGGSPTGGDRLLGAPGRGCSASAGRSISWPAPWCA
jgi:hypothetical protein